MKTNCKAVKDKIREHIKNYYTPEELKNQVEAIKCVTYPTTYHALKHMVNGGCFLIYNNEVQNFLNNLGINPEGNVYDACKSWELYCHLIARDGELLVKNAN